MNDARAALESHVAAHPGRHFNALVRECDLAPGQAQYHLRRLRRAGRVVREEWYGRTHYYPPDCDAWERGALALARRETVRDVLASLLRRGPAAPADVAADAGVARSTLEHHLDHLCERNVVEKRRDERGRVTLALVRPAATADVLATVDPSLAETLVDRFTRLVDDLLAER